VIAQLGLLLAADKKTADKKTTAPTTADVQEYILNRLRTAGETSSHFSSDAGSMWLKESVVNARFSEECRLAYDENENMNMLSPSGAVSDIKRITHVEVPLGGVENAYQERMENRVTYAMGAKVHIRLRKPISISTRISSPQLDGPDETKEVMEIDLPFSDFERAVETADALRTAARTCGSQLSGDRRQKVVH
jgi:hypothetical protein